MPHLYHATAAAAAVAQRGSSRLCVLAGDAAGDPNYRRSKPGNDPSSNPNYRRGSQNGGCHMGRTSWVNLQCALAATCMRLVLIERPPSSCHLPLQTIGGSGRTRGGAARVPLCTGSSGEGRGVAWQGSEGWAGRFWRLRAQQQIGQGTHRSVLS